jgi:hypothetical protein
MKENTMGYVNWRWLPLGALLALAGACAGPSGAVVSESRGSLLVQSWSDGEAVIAEVSLTASSHLIARFECNTRTRTMHTDVALSGDAGDRALPAGVGCEVRALTELAFAMGDRFASEPHPLASGGDQIAYDNGGCDITPGSGTSCCAQHDACYAAYGCSAWSWLAPFGRCTDCNDEAVLCYLRRLL